MCPHGLDSGERDDVTDAVMEIVHHLYASPDADLDEIFRQVTSTAVAVIDACDYASVTTFGPGGALVTKAPTDDVALTADLVQYEEGQGPCLDAVTRARLVWTPDVMADERWPRFSARLGGELEVHSMLSCRLAVSDNPNRNLGGLNLYSRKREGFTRSQRNKGLLLGVIASGAAEAARTQSQLVEAIKTRQTIGEAIGILRAQSDLSREEAFSMLAAASQRLNIKLRDVAARITDEGLAEDHPAG